MDIDKLADEICNVIHSHPDGGHLPAIRDALERAQGERDDRFKTLLKHERAGHRSTLYSISSRGPHTQKSAARRARLSFEAAKAIEVSLGLVEDS